MAQVSLDEARVKELFKQALIELLQEQKGLLYDLFVEVIEDLALVNAIKEGESSETINRAEVFQILESAA
jgi:spore coat polysaccharide biosynthesis protein SpsF (cytidylyltransferase family)